MLIVLRSYILHGNLSFAVGIKINTYTVIYDTVSPEMFMFLILVFMDVNLHGFGTQHILK